MAAKAQVTEQSFGNFIELKKAGLSGAAAQLLASQLGLVLGIIPPPLENSVFPYKTS